MNRITKITCETMRPIFERWDKAARLSEIESQVVWLRYFERRSLVYICDRIHYSANGVLRIYERAVEKVEKVLQQV